MNLVLGLSIVEKSHKINQHNNSKFQMVKNKKFQNVLKIISHLERGNISIR